MTRARTQPGNDRTRTGSAPLSLAAYAAANPGAQPRRGCGVCLSPPEIHAAIAEYIAEFDAGRLPGCSVEWLHGYLRTQHSVPWSDSLLAGHFRRCLGRRRNRGAG